MNIEEIDYKELVQDLLWAIYIDHFGDYEDSGFAIIPVIDEKTKEKEFHLIRNPEFSSITIPIYRKLTYAELGIVLGITPERYVKDGHDCKKCPEYKNCKAYFKDNEKQLQCRYWKENVDNSVYEHNLNHKKEEILNSIGLYER